MRCGKHRGRNCESLRSSQPVYLLIRGWCCEEFFGDGHLVGARNAQLLRQIASINLKDQKPVRREVCGTFAAWKETVVTGEKYYFRGISGTHHELVLQFHAQRLKVTGNKGGGEIAPGFTQVSDRSSH